MTTRMTRHRRETGVAPPVKPQWASWTAKSLAEDTSPRDGLCSSCGRRKGTARVITRHPGTPVLCEACYPLRARRVRENYMALVAPTEEWGA